MLGTSCQGVSQSEGICIVAYGRFFTGVGPVLPGGHHFNSTAHAHVLIV